jgi:hypothetical protein
VTRDPLSAVRYCKLQTGHWELARKRVRPIRLQAPDSRLIRRKSGSVPTSSSVSSFLYPRFLFHPSSYASAAPGRMRVDIDLRRGNITAMQFEPRPALTQARNERGIPDFRPEISWPSSAGCPHYRATRATSGEE